MKLGVFAPAASVLLPLRLNQGGRRGPALLRRSIGAGEALSLGLVATVGDDPAAAALGYFEQHLAGKSAARSPAPRGGARAMRVDDAPAPRRGRDALPRPDEDPCPDANEGLDAFLARPPGSTADDHRPTSPRRRLPPSSTAASSSSTTSTSTPSRRGRPPPAQAIGYMPVYVPREIIVRAGHAAGRDHGRRDALEVIQGDAYYQSYICRIPRSTIELGLTRRLDRWTACCSRRSATSSATCRAWEMLFPDKSSATSTPQNYEGTRSAASSTRSSRSCATTSPGRGREITTADLNAPDRGHNEGRAAIAGPW